MYTGEVSVPSNRRLWKRNDGGKPLCSPNLGISQPTGMLAHFVWSILDSRPFLRRATCLFGSDLCMLLCCRHLHMDAYICSHGRAYACPYPYAHSTAHIYPDQLPNTNTNVDPNSATNKNSNLCPLAFTHSPPNILTHFAANVYADSYPNRTANNLTNGHPNGRPNAHPDGAAYSHSNYHVPNIRTYNNASLLAGQKPRRSTQWRARMHLGSE